MNYTALALEKIAPGKQWAITDGLEIVWTQVDGQDVATNFIWNDQSNPPSRQDIDEAIKQIKAEIENSKYQRERAKEYPSIGDQLDALFKAGVFPEEMAAQIQAVKDKYPKG